MIKTYSSMGLWILLYAALFSPCRLWGQAWMMNSNNAKAVLIEGTPTAIDICNPKRGPTAGLRLTVYPPLTPSGGYDRWSVEISQSNGMAFATDMEFTVEIAMGFGDSKGPSLLIPVRLEQGKMAGQASGLMASWYIKNYYSVESKLEGRVLKGLSSYNIYLSNHYIYSQDGSALVVVSGEAAKDQDYAGMYDGQLREQMKWLKHLEQWCIPLKDWKGLNVSGGNQHVDFMATRARLPVDWLEFNSFGSVWIPIEMLSELTLSQSAALRQWLDGGGLLVVTRSDHSPEALATIDQWYAPGTEPDPKRWKKPSFFNNTPNESFRKREAGMGAVYANSMKRFRDQEQDPNVVNSTGRWQQNPVASTELSRSSWSTLHGVNLGGMAGENYWNWLIAGVGKPPVWTFGILIGIFAGLVAPALLYLTTKANRASWLLVLLPLVSLLATLLLVGYSLIYEGFESRIRTRSFTYYDRKEDRGFAWARQTLFSGAPQEKGLVIGRQTELTPMSWQEEFQSYRSKRRSQQLWSDQAQQFRLLMAARTQQQYLLRKPVQGINWFQLGEPTADKWDVTNTSDQTWQLAIFVDLQGDMWAASDVKPGSVASLAILQAGEAEKLASKLRSDNDLEVPVGLDQGQQLSVASWLFGRRGMVIMPGMARGAEPLMEESIREWTRGTGNLTEGCFVLFVEEGKHIDRALENAIEEKGLHVVGGQW
jgi:hypothetical protein